MRLFRAWVGWMPGGLAIVTVLVLAFFTPLTGASGVTILTMGGLLLPVLLGAGYPEKTSMGLVTVSGSIGLLLPPSLPVILYGYYSNQPIERLFVGGLLPGLLLITVVAGWGAFRGWQSGTERVPFRMGEALSALWEAKWELLLPVLVLGGIFGGFATLVEAAALTVVYAFVIECIVFPGTQHHPAIAGDIYRKRHAGRRIHDHSRRGSRIYELPRHRRSPRAGSRLGADPHRVETGLSAGAERSADCCRRGDGYLLGHHCDRAAGLSHGGGLWRRSGASGE